ncbi:MAG: hypothetical protein NTW29_10730 [Bacteroidetes bacterium]|nr:hypothetical protein [Bacteroidota bacterium]
MNDYELFLQAANLMEDYWEYPREDYEDSPFEIDHLGEESLNAFDAAMGFQSLRADYELKEFYHHDWADTTAVFVDDEDYQWVLNQQREVKIGDKYYKYLSNNIIAVISNNNVYALQLVRDFDMLALNPDIQYFNENTYRFENPDIVQGPSGTNGCADFVMVGMVNNLTPLNSTANEWDVELKTSLNYSRLPLLTGYNFSSIIAAYTVDWGDGTSESFTGSYLYVNRKVHRYSQPLLPGQSVGKDITITCQLIYPQASSGGLTVILNDCPQLIGKQFEYKGSVKLSTPATEDCMGGVIKRQFNGAQFSYGGNSYRLFCKLKQKSGPAIGFSNVVATAVFEKKKGSNWKKTKPIYNFSIELRGKVFSEYTCSDVFKTLSKYIVTTSKKKLKIRDNNVPREYRSRRSLPFAIQADFIWRYDNAHPVGAYNQVLKP